MHYTILFLFLSIGQGAPILSQFYNATRKFFYSSDKASPYNPTTQSFFRDPLKNLTNNFNESPMSAFMNRTIKSNSTIDKKENNTATIRNFFPDFNDVVSYCIYSPIHNFLK